MKEFPHFKVCERTERKQQRVKLRTIRAMEIGLTFDGSLVCWIDFSNAEKRGDSAMKTNLEYRFDDEPRDLHVCELKRDKNLHKLRQITGHPTVSCEFCGAEANSGEYVCSVVPWHKIRAVSGGNSHEHQR
jgi:hypothetical protein